MYQGDSKISRNCRIAGTTSVKFNCDPLTLCDVDLPVREADIPSRVKA